MTVCGSVERIGAVVVTAVVSIGAVVVVVVVSAGAVVVVAVVVSITAVVSTGAAVVVTSAFVSTGFASSHAQSNVLRIAKVHTKICFFIPMLLYNCSLSIRRKKHPNYNKRNTFVYIDYSIGYAHCQYTIELHQGSPAGLPCR